MIKVIDKYPKIKINKLTCFMANFSSKKIDNPYNLIKILLSNKTKYKKAFDAINKDISYMPLELIKKLKKKKYFFYREKRVKIILI